MKWSEKDILGLENAAAQAIMNNQVALSVENMNQYWTGARPIPSIPRLTDLISPDQIRRRLLRGDFDYRAIGVTDLYRDFYYGLRISRAISPQTGGPLLVSTRHVDVRDSLKKMGNPVDVNNKVYGMRFRLPPNDELSDGALAGVLAGGIVVEQAGQQWIEIADCEQVTDLLQSRGIWYWEKVGMGGWPFLRVSPFWAVVYADWSPLPHVHARADLSRPADCPFLPALCWELFFSGKGRRILDDSRGLPFGCSRRTIVRRGWNRKNLHREGVDSGMYKQEARLGRALYDWRERRGYRDERPDYIREAPNGYEK